ncbi:MAG: hypothetical protein ABIM88_09275 [candidate division WOR-3 bacterium]
MSIFHEFAERLILPGVVAHTALVLGFVGIVLLTGGHGNPKPGNIAHMEVKACSR